VIDPRADPGELDFAVATARAAGDRTLEWFRRADLEIDHKSDGSPVTAADLAAERLIREHIAARFPGDAILGEEEADVAGTTGRTWVIDPIDGTKAFTRGVPLYSVLIALVDQQGPVIGVIHLPALGETVWAGRGLGAFHDGEPCTVSDATSFDASVFCTSGAGYWPPEALRAVLDSPLTFRTWGDAYGYALVATGRAEAMVDPQAFPWDVAPMGVILHEAGGRFTSIDGTDDWRDGSGVATNGHIHEQLLALLSLPASG
jgi:histidinol-phosphatase